MEDFDKFPEDIYASLMQSNGILHTCRKEITQELRQFEFPIQHSIHYESFMKNDETLIEIATTIKNELEERGFIVELLRDTMGDSCSLVAMVLKINLK